MPTQKLLDLPCPECGVWTCRLWLSSRFGLASLCPSSCACLVDFHVLRQCHSLPCLPFCLRKLESRIHFLLLRWKIGVYDAPTLLLVTKRRKPMSYYSSVVMFLLAAHLMHISLCTLASASCLGGPLLRPRRPETGTKHFLFHTSQAPPVPRMHAPAVVQHARRRAAPSDRARTARAEARCIHQCSSQSITQNDVYAFSACICSLASQGAMASGSQLHACTSCRRTLNLSPSVYTIIWTAILGNTQARLMDHQSPHCSKAAACAGSPCTVPH